MKTPLRRALLVLSWLLSSSTLAQDVLAISWEDLLPEKDLQAYLNAPEIDHDGFGGDLLQDPDMPADYRAALQSVDVNPDLLEKRILLPGFIVPLAYNDERRVTEFFLVPYFGACIHVPPPPPNQLVYVNFPKGVEVDTLWEPFVIHGTLKSEITDNVVGLSAYTLVAEGVSVMSY